MSISRVFTRTRLAMSAVALTSAAILGAAFASSAAQDRTMDAPNVQMSILPMAFVQDGNTLVKIQALSEKSHLVAGETNWIGLVFNTSRDWHIYWRNPGNGMPTTWKLTEAPDGIELGDAVWPLPERYETEFGLDFVHHGRVFVMIPIDVDASVAKQGEVTIEIEAKWLVCKDICVPGKATASITLPVTSDPAKAAPARAAKAFKDTREAAPKVVEELKDEAIEANVGDVVTITKPGATELTFYPYENDEGVYPNEPKKDLMKKGDTLTIRYYDGDLELAQEIKGVLVVMTGDKEERFEITIPIR